MTSEEAEQRHVAPEDVLATREVFVPLSERYAYAEDVARLHLHVLDELDDPEARRNLVRNDLAEAYRAGALRMQAPRTSPWLDVFVAAKRRREFDEETRRAMADGYTREQMRQYLARAEELNATLDAAIRVIEPEWTP